MVIVEESTVKSQNNILCYVIIVLSMLLLIAGLEMLDSDTKLFFIKEGGLIELLSAAGYIVCIFFLLYQGRKRLESLSFWLTNLFLLFLCLREFDFHSRFTTMGITKTKFYVSPEVPFIEKIIGVVVTLLFFYTVLYLVRRHFRDFFTGLVNKKSWAIGILLGTILMIGSKFVDNQADFVELMLAMVGIEWNPISVNVEEVMELNIPIMFLCAILSRGKKSNKSSGLNEPTV